MYIIMARIIIFQYIHNIFYWNTTFYVGKTGRLQLSYGFRIHYRMYILRARIIIYIHNICYYNTTFFCTKNWQPTKKSKFLTLNHLWLFCCCLVTNLVIIQSSLIQLSLAQHAQSRIYTIIMMRLNCCAM